MFIYIKRINLYVCLHFPGAWTLKWNILKRFPLIRLTTKILSFVVRHSYLQGIYFVCLYMRGYENNQPIILLFIWQRLATVERLLALLIREACDASRVYAHINICKERCALYFNSLWLHMILSDRDCECLLFDARGLVVRCGSSVWWARMLKSILTWHDKRLHRRDANQFTVYLIQVNYIFNVMLLHWQVECWINISRCARFTAHLQHPFKRSLHTII